MAFPSIVSDKSILVVTEEDYDTDLALAIFEWLEIYYELEREEQTEQNGPL